jgi:hypothetical protein
MLPSSKRIKIRVFLLHVTKRDFTGKPEVRRESIARELVVCREECDQP